MNTLHNDSIDRASAIGGIRLLAFETGLETGSALACRPYDQTAVDRPADAAPLPDAASAEA